MAWALAPDRFRCVQHQKVLIKPSSLLIMSQLLIQTTFFNGDKERKAKQREDRKIKIFAVWANPIKLFVAVIYELSL
jgi:hypothetical protein